MEMCDKQSSLCAERFNVDVASPLNITQRFFLSHESNVLFMRCCK